MNEPQEPAPGGFTPLKTALDEMERWFHGRSLIDGHALYLARDLETAAHEAGLPETHHDISERISELRKWLEDRYGEDAEESSSLPE
jgi:hypothetical protein